MLIKPKSVLIDSREILIEMFTLSDVQGRGNRVERQRERWEKRHHRRRRRSISREKWVETLVVADPKMVEYYGKNGVESYVLAVMNIVSISIIRPLQLFAVGFQTPISFFYFTVLKLFLLLYLYKFEWRITLDSVYSQVQKFGYPWDKI